MPYLLKYATFDERLLVSEMDTEYGKVMLFKVENMEDTGGVECRCVYSPWRRLTRELRLTL